MIDRMLCAVPLFLIQNFNKKIFSLLLFDRRWTMFAGTVLHFPTALLKATVTMHLDT